LPIVFPISDKLDNPRGTKWFECLYLCIETFFEPKIISKVGRKDLHGNVFARFLMFSFIDSSHTASSKTFNENIRAELLCFHD
jgi:hypothetical protein